MKVELNLNNIFLKKRAEYVNFLHPFRFFLWQDKTLPVISYYMIVSTASQEDICVTVCCLLGTVLENFVYVSTREDHSGYIPYPEYFIIGGIQRPLLHCGLSLSQLGFIRDKVALDIPEIKNKSCI